MFELAYNQKRPIFTELGNTEIEIKPGYSNADFLGETTSHSEYDLGDEIEMFSIWVEPEVSDEYCIAVGAKDENRFSALKNPIHPYYSFLQDASETSLLKKVSDTIILPEVGINRLMLESRILELLSVNIER